MNTRKIETSIKVNEIMNLYPELTDFLLDIGLCGCDYGRESNLNWTIERVAKDKGIDLQELLIELNKRILM
ncbi:MAG: hypothetical protein V3V59_04045 [Thermodesulfovibrionales bacterium]